MDGGVTAAGTRTVTKDHPVSHLFRVVVAGADGLTVTSDTVAVTWAHPESGPDRAITEPAISASAETVG